MRKEDRCRGSCCSELQAGCGHVAWSSMTGQRPQDADNSYAFIRFNSLPPPHFSTQAFSYLPHTHKSQSTRAIRKEIIRAFVTSA